MTRPHKGYDHNLHTRLSPEAMRGWYALADGAKLSDTFDLLGSLLDSDPEFLRMAKERLARTPIEEQKSFWAKLIDTTKAALAGLAIGAAVSTGEPAIAEPPPPIVEQAITPEAPTELPRPNTWTRIERQLEERVNAQNFEIWLSSVRCAGDDGKKLTLLVPNVFFREYLTDHYTEVIQETLWYQLEKKYEIVFVARPQEEEAPKPPTPPKPKTREEELKDIEAKLRAGIPLDVLESDVVLLETKYKLLYYGDYNHASYEVSKKVMELRERYIERLRVLRQQYQRRPAGKRLPPKRNDRPWRK